MNILRLILILLSTVVNFEVRALDNDDGTYYDPDEDILSHSIIYVSLGYDCLPASCMREAGFRHAAFPFDWNVTPYIDKITQVLNEDFEYFLALEE